jgi:hypothetical protein
MTLPELNTAMTHIKRYGLWLATATEAADADPREVAACLNLAAGCLDDAAKELRQAATRLHTRPFTGPCRTWSDQAKTLSSEDIEASLGAQKLESQP